MAGILDTICVTVTAPGAAYAAMAGTISGDSLTIRNINLDKPIWLLSVGQIFNAAGRLRIRSPKLHDARDGLQFRVRAADPVPVWPMQRAQRLVSQDTLLVDAIGSAVGGQIETAILQVYYSDMPRANYGMISPDELRANAINEFPVEVQHTAAVTGAYTNPLAINANFDDFKANTPYAVIGASFDTAIGGATLRGSDTNNYRVFVPGVTVPRNISSNWFIRLSQAYGLSLIPVIFSPNRASTISEVIFTQAGGAVNVTWHLVELPMTFVPKA